MTLSRNAATLEAKLSMIAERAGIAPVHFANSVGFDVSVAVDSAITRSPTVEKTKFPGREHASKCCDKHDDAHRRMLAHAESVMDESSLLKAIDDDVREKPMRYATPGKHEVTESLDVHTHVVDDCETCRASGQVTCGTCRGHKVETCPDCSGYGKFTCRWCSGSGRNTCTRCNGAGNMWDGRVGRAVRCDWCHGNGKYGFCGSCNGHGAIRCGDCQGHGRIHCRTCGARGKVRCSPCEGQGAFVTLYTAAVRLLIEPALSVVSSDPHGHIAAFLGSYLGRLGKEPSYKPKVSDIEHGDDRRSTAHLSASLPYAATTMKIGEGKGTIIGAWGNDVRWARVPTFLEKHLAPVLERMRANTGRKAAKDVWELRRSTLGKEIIMAAVMGQEPPTFIYEGTLRDTTANGLRDEVSKVLDASMKRPTHKFWISTFFTCVAATALVTLIAPFYLPGDSLTDAIREWTRGGGRYGAMPDWFVFATAALLATAPITLASVLLFKVMSKRWTKRLTGVTGKALPVGRKGKLAIASAVLASFATVYAVENGPRLLAGGIVEAMSSETASRSTPFPPPRPQWAGATTQSQ